MRPLNVPESRLSCTCIPLCIHCCDFTTRYEVLNASGDRFQFGGVFKRLD